LKFLRQTDNETLLKGASRRRSYRDTKEYLSALKPRHVSYSFTAAAAAAAAAAANTTNTTNTTTTDAFTLSTLLLHFLL